MMTGKHLSTKTYRCYQEPQTEEDWDMISHRFIRLVAGDPSLDHALCTLLALFAPEPPEMYGGYNHHGR